MRWILWWVMVATVAVAAALVLGSHDSNVTLYWHPWRIDMSLNFVLFMLVLVFTLLYVALRAMSLLRELPQRAHRWRTQQSERAAFMAVLDAVAYQLSGRFVRAQSSASQALKILQERADEPMPHQPKLQLLAQLLAAESANALGNTDQREAMLQAIEDEEPNDGTQAAREGAYVRAASWALDAKDADRARHWLSRLPQGAQRRIQAVRLRLKLAQLDRNSHQALDMVRLLVKHKALSSFAANTLSRSLALEVVQHVHDAAQLQNAWQRMEPGDREQPALVLAFLQRWQQLRPQLDAPLTQPMLGAVEQAIQALWAAYPQLSDPRRQKALMVLDDEFGQRPAQWLSPVEQALQRKPNDAGLQFLAGRVFLQQQLWGKAQAHLLAASKSLQDPELLRRTWRGLALLAEQRGDETAAAQAWKKAANC
jgi:HemY protein